MLSTIQTPAPIVGSYVGHLLYDLPINVSIKSSKNSSITVISNGITSSSSSCVNDDTTTTDDSDSYPHAIIGQLDIHDVCYKEFDHLSVHQLYHHHYSYDRYKSNKNGKLLYHILSSRRMMMMSQKNNSSQKFSSIQINNKRTHSSNCNLNNNAIVNMIDGDEDVDEKVDNTGYVTVSIRENCDQDAMKLQNIHTKYHDLIAHKHKHFKNDNNGDTSSSSSNCLVSNICDAHGIKINSYKGLKSLTGSS